MNQTSNSTPTISFREFTIAALVLAAAILLFWWHVWIPSASDRMHFTDDVFIKDYPTRMGLFRQVLEGRLPLWDSFQFGGWPGLANCEAGVFYPFNWVLIPFSNSPETSFEITQWLALFHFFIAGLGAYRYARYIGCSPLASGFAGIAFTFCGFFCAHKKHTNMLFSLAWFPWLLLLAERRIREKKSRFLLQLALLFTLAHFAGHPQSSLYQTILVAARLLYGVYEEISPGSPSRGKRFLSGLFPILAVLIVSAGLSAIQYAPTMELIQQSERSDADVYERSREFSMPPTELLETFLPEIMSSWSQTEVFYWGLVPLLLAIHFLLRGRLQAIDRYLLGAFIASILLSLGDYLFVYDLSYLLIPGAAWVRAPSRWIFFAGLPLVLAAARELDYFLSGDSAANNCSIHPAFWKIVGTLGVLIAGTLVFVIFTSDYAVAPDARFAVRQGMLRALLYLILFGGAFLFLFHMASRRLIQPSVFAVAAILIAWVDLGTQFRAFELQPGVGGYTSDTEVKKLTEAGWTRRAKVFFNMGADRTLYHGAAQNFQELDGQSPLTPRLSLQLREDTNMPFPDKLNLALYRLLGVQAFLTDIQDLPSQFKKETSRLYRLDSPAPRAFVLHEYLPVETEAQRDLIKLQSFPWSQVAVVENDAAPKADSETPPDALFPKPFLLASCSINAVSADAILIVDGKNQFGDLKEKPPGYYFAVADSDTGEIEDAQAFNLMESWNDPQHKIHQRMLKFLHDIPDGKTVFAAIKDNASNCLLPIGLSALREIGASLDVRGRFRWAHAVVGRKGAPIGSALEIVSPTESLVLQTPKSLYIEGEIRPKPEPEWQATTHLADKWYALQKEMNKNQSQPLAYDASQVVRHATDPLYLSTPVTIYSAPKKYDPAASPTEDRASIMIAGKEYALNQRGYNLVVVNPKTLQVVTSEAFDLLKDLDYSAAPTFINPASPENRRMRDFIRSITDGNIILGAIRDDSTDLMTQATLESLHALGSNFTFDAVNPNARKNISHAFIAIKGATICIESFGKEKDSILFNRCPGGPALSHTDAPLQEGQFFPKNPVDEMEAILPETPLFEKFPSTIQAWAVVNDETDRLLISGDSENGGLVFLSEIFYPGWKAYLDGALQPIRRVNYYFRGVEVGAGRHEIELIYDPESFRRGAAISAAALLAIIVWGVALFFIPKANQAS